MGVKTQIKEIAHGLILKKEKAKLISRQQKEIEAETAAYLASKSFGLHGPHLPDQTRIMGSRQRKIVAHFDTIHTTAQTILKAIND